MTDKAKTIPTPTPEELCTACLRRAAVAHFRGDNAISLNEAEFVELYLRDQLKKRDLVWSYQGLDVDRRR